MTLIEDNVPKMKESLEKSFREILGVLKPEGIT